MSAFTNLQWLHCYDNQLTSLPDLSACSWLQQLRCENNQLTSFPDLSAANVQLQKLYCEYNQLTSLPDLSGNVALQELYCNDNLLTSLPNFSMAGLLAELRCWNNELTTLPSFPNSLTALDCGRNQLISLPDLSTLTVLQYLYCSANQLTTLPDLTNNTALLGLSCFANQLTTLPDLTNNTALLGLSCYNNQLTALPDLTNNTVLEYILCENNKLDFSDVRELRIADNISTLNSYSYSPQNPFGVADIIILNVGDTLILSIASQDSALSYQWFRDTDTIAGATDTLLQILNVTSLDVGIYTCRSYGTALEFPSPMNFFPGISSFVSEPFAVYLTSSPKAFIPDTNFRNFLNASYPVFMDASGDSLIIDFATTLTGTFDCSSQNIADLTGVEYFVNITTLWCFSNQLTTLPDLTNITALQLLSCSANQLTVMPDLSNNTALQTLACSSNQLTALPDLTNNTALEYLYCNNNKLDFSDARELRIADTISTLIDYIYSPQNPFGIADTFNLNVGDSLILSIANQDSALSYQWFRETNTIAGATDTLLIIPNVALADSGVYTCRSYGTALLSPSPMSFSPGINNFISEGFKVNINMPPSLIFIPDTNFRNFLNATYPAFMDASGDSLLIDSAATLTGTLNCVSRGIADLTGVEYFINITFLYCWYNQLTTLPALTNNTALLELYCFNNQLAAFPDLTNNIALQQLGCSNNQLTTLPDLTNNTALLYLSCSNNQLTTLPDLTNNTALEYLGCSGNQLTSLPDLTNNIALQSLGCIDNQLTSLPDLTNNTALQWLGCSNNQLTALPDLTNNIALQSLGCSNNQLTSLPDLTNNTSLQTLNCTYNQLTALPDLTNNTALIRLYCNNNKLDFSDARELRIANTISSLITYNYYPQNPFGIPDTFDLNAGDTLILSITNQDSALSYQWFRGTNTIVGATDTLLIIPNVTLTDSGIYTCRSFGTALLFPSPMNFGPSISSFVSEPLTVNISGPSASISYQKNVSCNGGQDGEAAVTVTGGSPPYTLQWSDSSSQITDTAYNLYEGIYYVVVTDSLGAVNTAYVTITEPPAITGSQTLNICSGDSVVIGISVYDTTGVYTDIFIASNGCDSTFTTNLTVDPVITGSQTLTICAGDSVVIGISVYDTTGTYTDVFTAFNGCDSTVTTNLTVNDLPTASFIGLDTSYCLTATAATLTGTPSGGTFSGTGISGNQFNPANADTGTHTITYTYTDGNNCTDSVFQNVTVNNCTGINNQSSINNNQLKVYPNPNTGRFDIEVNITHTENFELKIVNSLGQELFTEELKQFKGIYKKHLELNQYPAGIYNIQLLRDKGVINKQIIIE